MRSLLALTFAAVSIVAAPVSAQPSSAEKKATITLVRWPFTCSLSDPAELLIRDVASELGDRVVISIEEYGASELARRFGVRRFPVVFVGDVLVARPKDFGFGGRDDAGGRYVPWKDPANRRRFRADLRSLVLQQLRGAAGVDSGSSSAGAEEADGPERLPALDVDDTSGRGIDVAHLRGRVVIVEFWAAWCPPCRSTLAWLNALARDHADRVTVIAIAVDSAKGDVLRLQRELGLSFHLVHATPELVATFGTLAAVPRLLVFDASGRRAGAFLGAPPDLHQQVERVTLGLLK